MYLKHIQSGDLIEVMAVAELVDPCAAKVLGRLHAGEELQDPESFSKDALQFPSGEALPRCWIDPDYRASRTSR